MNRALLLAGLALILAAANWAIVSRERLKSSGQLVYLELAPVDPRSLLRYKIDLNTPGTAESGYLIIRLDDRHVAKAVGWNSQPAAGEIRLKYRSRYGRTSIGSDAYFFQEGTSALYESARYGEFRVAENGDALLTALRDANLTRLGPP